MPANHRQAASQTPASPNNKATARYTNKDGSKIITVPKGPPSAEPSLPSTPTSSANDPNPNAGVANGVESQQPAINRKKQKRRAKAAAKAAAEQAAVQTPNGRPSLAPADPAPSFLPTHDDPDQDFSDDDHDDHRSLDDGLEANGVAGAKSKKSKKKKKKKGKNSQQLVHAQFDGMPHSHSHSHSHPHSPLPSAGHAMSKDKIWNTSSNQERLRIKEFWLNLGEDERKSLVKVEKDAVLRKMKEQQKHTCSCTVCGRKRTAIEEELEGLYDAYYMELESFAHHSESPPLLGTPHHADFPLRSSQLPLGYERRPPSHSAEIVHHNGDDEEDDEDAEVDYSEDEDDEDLEDDDEYSDEGLDDPEEVQPDDRDVADFLTFGNSLQVKGGILTVADDLLKNDGRRFIEMMEQLAERRMAREEDAREGFSRPYGHPPNGSYSSHDPHPPQDDDYDDDEEDDEDEYDSQDDEFEEEEDTMTEKQRMEEGRRMFQIFAARMFEQRVLAAYRDMVAKQRQQQLIAEIDEESRQDEQRKAKKAKENQKRKDKAALKKQQAAEDKARREAEKAAEEAARREEQRRKTEEQRLRAEEKRRKKEEQKRHEEEERLRKEAERLRRLQEQQEKRAEQERKARESREKAQKLKEETRQREKEAREQREREARDRKEKQEQAKRDKEQKAKAEKDNRERLKQEDKAAQKAAAMAAAPIPIPNQGRRPSQHPVPVPTHPPNPASFASPKIPVATPTISKAPTPIRPKNAQPLDTGLSGSLPSNPGSAASQNPSPHPATPGHTSPATIGPSRKGSLATTTSLQHPQSVSPSSIKSLGTQPGTFGMSMGMPPAYPPGYSGNSFTPHPPGLSSIRPPPGMISGPPGLIPPGRAFPPGPPPGFSSMGELYGMVPGPGSHIRQGSGSFDVASPPGPTQPIGRPAPIGRPGSVVQGQRMDPTDDLANQHLGSSALLDDSDAPNPIVAGIAAARHHSQPQQQPFPSISFRDNRFGSASSSVWGPPTSMPYGHAQGPPPGLGNSGWASPIMPTLSLAGSMRTGNTRSVAVRQILCYTCKELQSRTLSAESFVDLSAVKAEVDQARPQDIPVTEEDLLALAETEGNAHNGGGTFQVHQDARGPGQHMIRWEPQYDEMPHAPHRAVGAPGEIVSPIIGGGSLASARGL